MYSTYIAPLLTFSPQSTGVSRKCLPDGTAVIVELESSGDNKEFRRVRGGTTSPEAEAKPIIFSQAELARRSMDAIPSVELLDIHCPQGEVHKLDIKEIFCKVRSAFTEVANLATQARELRLEVEKRAGRSRGNEDKIP